MATWRTKDGREIPISEMEDSHLFNSIRLLERKAGNLAISYGDERAFEYLTQRTKYMHLLVEAGKRNAIRCEEYEEHDGLYYTKVDGILLADENSSNI